MATTTKNMQVVAGNANASVTAQVTDSMPGVPCPGPAGYTYKGLRYVPVFADPAEWSSANSYEALTIVLHEGNSYTSKQAVPVGIDISNETYWALTGNYNAQVEQYKKLVESYLDQLNNISEDVNEYKKTYDRVYLNVSEMKTDTNITSGMRVLTLGFYEAGDGGECQYLVTDIEPTKYHENLSNSLYAQLIDPDNIRQYGAYGDGIHDDTVSIQTAVNENEELKIPSGKFYISESIAVKNAIHIKGIGNIGLSNSHGGASSIIMVNFDGPGFNLDYNETDQVFRGCYFEGFAIQASKTAQNYANANGVRVFSWNHCTFDNLGIYNFATSSGMIFVGAGQYSTVKNCKFANCNVALDVPRYFGLKIFDNMFDNNGNGTEPNTNPKVGTYAIKLSETSGDSHLVYGNTIQGFQYGIYLGTNSSRCKLANNRFEMFNTGIVIKGKTHIIETGNSFDRYLGKYEGTGTAVVLDIDSEVKNIMIEPMIQSSVDNIPIKNLAGNGEVVRKDIITGYAELGDVSGSKTFVLFNPYYTGILSRVIVMASNNEPIGNTTQNYWEVSATTRKSLWTSNGKNWNGSPLQIFDQATETSGTASNSMVTIKFNPHNTPTTINSLCIYYEFERYVGGGHQS